MLRFTYTALDLYDVCPPSPMPSDMNSTQSSDLSSLRDALSQNPPNRKNLHLQRVRKAARWMPCYISPFIDFDNAFNVGMYSEGRLKTDENGEEYPDPETTLEPEHCQDLIQTYHKIFRKLPYLKDYVTLFENDPVGLKKLTEFMKHHANAVRNSDTNNLRYSVYAYAGRNGTLTDFGGKNASKSIRGFFHRDSGRLNCPMGDVSEFDEDWERYRDLVEKEKKIIDEDNWPCNVYEEGLYDPDNLEAGLMRGDFVMNVIRHIYTGGRTAGLSTDGPSKGKGGKGKIHSQEEVTPEMIAYGVVHARFSLSSQNSWPMNGKDGSFDYVQYYRNVLELFDDPSDPWCTDLLSWYTKNTCSQTRLFTKIKAFIHCKTTP
ncbi:hypothetical protein NLI96_g4781 [Meripilus lineatus]|uniref:Uncharacterized protein n=1 Tax=Meripilus lineatus TaxID=2056292 RepID=A0AAD5YHM3_9APHY|nr:hypothetical protein NLI96_g4781 [Physisporinus lineatus]